MPRSMLAQYNHITPNGLVWLPPSYTTILNQHARRYVLLSLATALLLGGCGSVNQPSPTTTSDTRGGAAANVDEPPSGLDEPSLPVTDQTSTLPEPSPIAVESTTPSPKISSKRDGGAPAITSTEVGEETLQDTTIIPGERLGLVTTTTTYEQLGAEFGSDRLTETEVHLGEGFMSPGTRVDLGANYSFSIVWTDSDRTTPMEIRDIGSGWTTPEGIHNGMTFDALQTALGSFQLFGFGWDYGGTVLLDQTAIASYGGDLLIRVQPSATDWETKQEQLRPLIGDQIISSTDPNLSGLNIAVYELIVRLNNP